MRIAIYPGSFDPITNGHLDIIDRAAFMFDKLIITVSKNSGKKPLFSVDERIEMLKSVLAKYPNVSVDSFDDLTINYADSQGAQVILRGLRAISDFENEFQMALTNKKLMPSVETIFLMAKAEYSFLSSSVVKELASYGGCIKGFVPAVVEAKLTDKYNKNTD